MIFWLGYEKRSGFLCRVAYVDNIVYLAKKPKNHTRSFSMSCLGRGDVHFLDNLAIVWEDTVTLYNIRWYKRQKEFRQFDRFKIYTEEDDISTMPKHVLVKTNNLDFIRELFDLGKKVSWFDPDLNFFASDLAKFNFEHLFLNVFNTKKWIFPTGKTRDAYDEYGKFFLDIKNPNRSVKYGKKIGFYPHILMHRVPKYDYYRATLKNNSKHGIKHRLGRVYLFPDNYQGYYNILSISYMLWHKSTVADAQEKIALKD